MKGWKENYTAYLMVVPAVAYVVIFSFYPSLQAVYGSFQTPTRHFVLVNYKELGGLGVEDAIYNTVVVTLCALALQFTIALGIATLLTKEFRGKSFFQVSYIIPFGVATIVSVYVFGNIFEITGGYANAILRAVGLHPLEWTEHTNYWLNVLTLVIADSWKNTPIVAIILVSGMSTISPDIYAAAKVDGAGPISRFIHITLPNLSAYIAIALIIRGISEFNIFAMALLLFPHEILTTLVYGLFTTTFNDFLSYAAATVLLAFILVFATIVIIYRNRTQVS